MNKWRCFSVHSSSLSSVFVLRAADASTSYTHSLTPEPAKSEITYSVLMRPLFWKCYAKHPVNHLSKHPGQKYMFDLRFDLKCNYTLPAAWAVVAPSGRHGSMRDILRGKKGRGSDPLSWHENKDGRVRRFLGSFSPRWGLSGLSWKPRPGFKCVPAALVSTVVFATDVQFIWRVEYLE